MRMLNEKMRATCLLITNNMSACAFEDSVKTIKTYQIMLHLDGDVNLEALKYKTFTLTIQL
jgi:hypothetical protein